VFTGIVEETGIIKRITRQNGIIRLEVSARQVMAETKIGDSIAANGACLTVVDISDNLLSFEVMAQTFTNTNLGQLKIGQPVNLERSLKVGDRVGGHFVSGHVDCVGLVRKRTLRQGSLELEIAVPADFRRYCLPKGSICVNGVSLTLAKTRANIFTVCIIPHTFKNTTLSSVRPSDKLNVEFDILAKRNPA